MKGSDGPPFLYTHPKFPTLDGDLQHLLCRPADLPDTGRQNETILQKKMFEPIAFKKGCIFLNILKLEE